MKDHTDGMEEPWLGSTCRIACDEGRREVGEMSHEGHMASQESSSSLRKHHSVPSSLLVILGILRLLDRSRNNRKDDHSKPVTSALTVVGKRSTVSDH